MPSEDAPASKGKWSRLGLVVGWMLLVFVLLIVAGLFVPVERSPSPDLSKRNEASDNARKVILAMRAYAADHHGAYPDADPSQPKTANEMFRVLIKQGYVKDERIFGAPISPAHPDGNIGEAPDFRQALKPGENHWAVMTGLTTSSPGAWPLVFECPNDSSWPPSWNGDAEGKPVRGRAWRGGRIIIGRNDGSVAAEKLEAVRGESISLLASAVGNLFDSSPLRKYLQPE